MSAVPADMGNCDRCRQRVFRGIASGTVACPVCASRIVWDGAPQRSRRSDKSGRGVSSAVFVIVGLLVLTLELLVRVAAPGRDRLYRVLISVFHVGESNGSAPTWNDRLAALSRDENDARLEPDNFRVQTHLVKEFQDIALGWEGTHPTGSGFALFGPHLKTAREAYLHACAAPHLSLDRAALQQIWQMEQQIAPFWKGKVAPLPRPPGKGPAPAVRVLLFSPAGPGAPVAKGFDATTPEALSWVSPGDLAVAYAEAEQLMAQYPHNAYGYLRHAELTYEQARRSARPGGVSMAKLRFVHQELEWARPLTRSREGLNEVDLDRILIQHLAQEESDAASQASRATEGENQ